MSENEHIEVKVTLIKPDNATLRQLETWRRDLGEQLRREVGDEVAGIYQRAPSRSVDPAVIGALTLVLAPVLLEKVADLVLKFVHPETVSVQFSLSTGEIITVNLRDSSPEKLRERIRAMRQAVADIDEDDAHA